MLAIEASADDVCARLVAVGLGIRELAEQSGRDPPVAPAVVHGRADEIGRVDALAAREAAALVAAVMAILEARVPARRELVGEPARQLELAFALPVAVEALFFRRRREVGGPGQPVLEEVPLQNELAFELALIRAPCRLNV